MDRFGDTAKKGFDFLKNRAMETVEYQRLSSNLKKLEDRRDRCLMDIGHRVNVMFDLPEFDREEVRDRVEELRELNARLEELREQRDHLTEKAEQSQSSAGGASRIPHPDYLTDRD